jgi:lysophospholipase L1-like esterase
MSSPVPDDDRIARLPIILFSAAAVLIAVVWFFAQYGFVTAEPEPRAVPWTGSVVFIGSSTIQRFRLDRSFPAARFVNLGVPDQNSVAMRERVARDLPADARPAGFVLYAGSYDLRAETGVAPAVARDRVAAIVADLQARFPDAPIVLLEVLPGRDQSDAERRAVGELNAGLAALALERKLAFVRTHRPPLVDEKGNLPESMSVDRFHLNEAGYRALAKWLQEDGGAVGEMLR